MNKYLNPKKYWNRAFFYWNFYWNKIYYERTYNLEHIRMIEKQKFDTAGFQYDKALKKLDKILGELGKPDFAAQKGMGSIHWLLF